MASPRSPQTSRGDKTPESLKEAVRTPIRDWEQPGLDNAIKAAEDYLAKNPGLERKKPPKPNSA